MTINIVLSINDETIRKALADPQLVKGPIMTMLKKSALMIEQKAKLKATVDTGHMRRGIKTFLSPLQAVIEATEKYSAFVEMGTRPHWPPRKALQPWARRHGFPPGMKGASMLAAAIAKRGTKAQPFMMPALEESKNAIQGLIQQAANQIRERWRR